MIEDLKGKLQDQNTLEAENLDMREQLRKLGEELQLTKSQRDTLASQNVGQLTRELETERDRIKLLEQGQQEDRKEILRLQHELGVLRPQSEELDKKTRDLEADLKTLAAQAARDKDTAILALREKETALQEKNTLWGGGEGSEGGEVSRLRERVSALERDLEDAQEHIRLMQEEAQEFSSSVAQLDEYAQSLVAAGDSGDLRFSTYLQPSSLGGSGSGLTSVFLQTSTTTATPLQPSYAGSSSLKATPMVTITEDELERLRAVESELAVMKENDLIYGDAFDQLHYEHEELKKQWFKVVKDNWRYLRSGVTSSRGEAPHSSLRRQPQQQQQEQQEQQEQEQQQQQQKNTSPPVSTTATASLTIAGSFGNSSFGDNSTPPTSSQGFRAHNAGITPLINFRVSQSDTLQGDDSTGTVVNHREAPAAAVPPLVSTPWHASLNRSSQDLFNLSGPSPIHRDPRPSGNPLTVSALGDDRGGFELHTRPMDAMPSDSISQFPAGDTSNIQDQRMTFLATQGFGSMMDIHKE